MPIWAALAVIKIIKSNGYWNVHGSSLASVPGLPRYAIYCARLIVRGRETLKTGKAWDETSRAHRTPGRARPVASTANMYTLASVRLLKLLADSYM